jgi:hypothetical protein
MQMYNLSSSQLTIVDDGKTDDGREAVVDVKTWY